MSEDKVPGLSIDEALALFLSLTYPNGLPEGVDREAFLRVLREKIAADRPEWAAASPPPQAPGPEAVPSAGYSQVKAGIVEQAQQPEVPSDPGERYFYERHEEARRNREQRQAQEREERIKAELRQRLSAENQASDEVVIERALRIRQSLEARLRQTLQMQAGTDEDSQPLLPTLSQPGRFVMEQAAPGISPSEPPPAPAGLTFTPQVAPATAVTPPDSSREYLETLKQMKPAEQVESLRQFNRARREKLKPREEVLNPRRPAHSKREQVLALEEIETPGSTALTLESQASPRRAAALEISSAARPDARGLRLEKRSKP